MSTARVNRLFAAVGGALAIYAWLPTHVAAVPGPKNVSMRFVNADLTVVLRSLAEQVGFDLVIGPGIDTEIDVNLNDVAWPTALDAIASANDVSYHWRDNVLIVLPDAESSGEFLSHQVVTLNYANPVAVQSVLSKVLVAPAKAELLQSVAVSPANTNVSVNSVPPLLVISETAQGMAAVLALIDSLDVARPQFEIGVKFVETSLDDKMGVGLNWPTKVTASIAQEGSTDENSDEQGPAASYDIPDGKTWRIGTLSIGELSGFLEVLDQNGKSKLLSDPRVSVIESERAVMRVATTIPVQTLNRFSEGGTIQDIVSFQDLDVGITLAVTPRLNEGEFITLDVEPSVEEITGFTGPADNQRPITSKRTVRTTVRVRNNETVVIGGLVRETDIRTKSGIFLLSDIPLLGALFSHHKIEKQKTDLLIFITPRIVDPLAAN